MAQSVRRKIKRGHIRLIWNATLNRMDFFRKTKKGTWILNSPFANRDLAPGPGHSTAKLDEWAGLAKA